MIFDEKPNKRKIFLEKLAVISTIAGTITAMSIAVQNYFDAKKKYLDLEERLKELEKEEKND